MKPTVCQLLIHDGREDYLERTLASADEALPAFDQYIVVDDSDHRLGFAGAIQAGWGQVEADYVFHLEADFTFRRPVPVDAMVDMLALHPYLVQMALLRQPWNDSERRAGGIVQQFPDDFEYCHFGDLEWLEHRRYVTTNPSLWPRWVIERGWPQRSESEGHFGIDLFASDPRLKAAYWGDGSEWVTHIGTNRAGNGY